MSNKLRAAIYTIPPNNEWFHALGEHEFIRLGQQLLAKGLSESEVLQILTDAYHAVAREFGE